MSTASQKVRQVKNMHDVLNLDGLDVGNRVNPGSMNNKSSKGAVDVDNVVKGGRYTN